MSLGWWKLDISIDSSQDVGHTPDDLDNDLNTNMSFLNLLGVLNLLDQSEDSTKDLLLEIIDTFLDVLTLGKESRENRHESSDQWRVA